MVSYAEDKFVPGVTPTQKDLAYQGQLSAVVDGSVVVWFDVTWAVTVQAGAALTDVFAGAPQFPSTETDAAAAVTGALGPLGLYFSAPYPLPDGVVTELQLAGDDQATVALEAQ